jgi:alkylation response protein AidB-like acyl-CoA dehydrogenase
MDLPVPESVRPLRERFLRFVIQRIHPIEAILERGWYRDPEAGQRMAELRAIAKAEGLWAIGHPEEIGGGGLPFMDYVYVNEAIGYGGEAAVWATGTGTLQDSIMLHTYASPEWREKYLRPLVDGEIIQSFGMTEPGVASSDPTQLRTTAVLEGDHWVIRGRKWFTSLAHYARYTTVIARTEPLESVRRPHEAFSAIIVPTDTPGYRIVRAVPVFGETVGDHCEVEYDGVRVPASNLLGKRGQGFRLGQTRLGAGRIFHAMRFLGQAQRAFDLMCARAVRRRAFGSLLADKQLVRKMVFDTAAEIRGARHVVLEAAQRMDQGDDARVEVGIAKVLTAQLFQNAVDRAIQVHGAAGVTADFPLERMFRYARQGRIWDGPDETHVDSVSRRLLEPYRRAAAAAGEIPEE